MSKGATTDYYQIFKEQIDTKISSYLDSCTNCGLCSDACLFFTETNDSEYTPINKIKPLRAVWELEYTILGKLKKIFSNEETVLDSEKLDKWQRLIYDSCTMCARCTLVCPSGIDIVYIIRRMRQAMKTSGYAPQDLEDATKRAIKTGSPMGINFKTLEAQIKHIEKELGFKLPIDKKGAEYLVIFSSMEIINFYEYISAIALIFKKASQSWTISSKSYEATNSGIQIGDDEISRTLVSRIVDEAESLGVKYVVSPECGHAYTSLRWEGPNLINRKYNFKVFHIIELLYNWQQENLIQLKKSIDEPISLHDPCQIARRGGVVDQPHYLLNLISDDVVEMDENKSYNWCCGAGGGVSAIERAKNLRHTIFEKKYNQIKDLKVKKISSPCANCRIALEDGLEYMENNDIEIVGFTELLLSCCENNDN